VFIMPVGSFELVLVGLTVMLLAAKATGELAERLGQPAVVGELLVGVLLGNLPLVGVDVAEPLRHEPVLETLAGLGALLLLFEVGLASKVADLLKVGVSSFLVALFGVIAPMALGYAVTGWLRPDLPAAASLFVSATLAATSVGITARVLQDLGALERTESRIILGAAVIDDIMGLVVLALVQGLVAAAEHGGAAGLGAADLAGVVLKAVGFLVGAVVIGGWVAPRLFRAASFLRVHSMLLVTALAICFLSSWVSAAVGLAPIVGAFAAGLVLDEVHFADFAARGERSLADEVRPLATLLVPLFFVHMGLAFDLRALAHGDVLELAAFLALAAVAGKQVCGLGALGPGLDRVAIGIGMIPRGEVGLIIADVGRRLELGGRPVVDPAMFSAVVVVVITTTLLCPPILKARLTRRVASS
jgi:Kef-type K+ transport system membrane component KefB